MWHLVADSSCDMHDFEDQEHGIRLSTIPFKINFADREYIDDDKLQISEVMDMIDSSKEAGKTACPSPGDWEKLYSEEGHALAFTISQNLSGSFNSAVAGMHMAKERDPEKKVAVIDSWATGPATVIIIDKVIELIKAGEPFEKVVEKAEEQSHNTHTIFALCSYNNLIKNGRMKPLAGFFAKALKLWGVGIATDDGRIKIKGSARGERKIIQSIIEDMKERRSRDNEVVISHADNLPLAQKLKEAIMQEFAMSEDRIKVIPTRGLDCFYAERSGIIVSY